MNERSQPQVSWIQIDDDTPRKKHRFYKVTFTAVVSHSNLADLCEGLINGSRYRACYNSQKLHVEQTR